MKLNILFITIHGSVLISLFIYLFLPVHKSLPTPCRSRCWGWLMLTVCPVAWQRKAAQAVKAVETQKRRRTDRARMTKRGQRHNREIIRTRPLCMNPSTSTQLCQTAWAIIFSNSCGLESDYRAPSVTQTLVPKQVTSWLFICFSSKSSRSAHWNMVHNRAEFATVLSSFAFRMGWRHGIIKEECERHTCRGSVMDGELFYNRLLTVYLSENV